MRNFLNTNDVFPILDIVRREIKKHEYDRNRVFIGDSEAPVTGRSDEVVSLEILRGGNEYDPELIDSVIATYADGSTEVITLIRGANPPVPDTVPNHEFINKALLSGFTVEITSAFESKVITGELVRENGYGRVQGVNLTHS